MPSEQTGWRPWGERPRSGQVVLAWFPGRHGTGHCETVWCYADHWHWFDGDTSDVNPPTHWMPHPDMPEEVPHD